MFRFTLGTLLAVGFALPTSAQVPVSVASGVGSFGGGVRPATPSLMAPIGGPFHRPAPFFAHPAFRGRQIGGFGGGFVGGPFVPFYGGFSYQPYYVVPLAYPHDPTPPPPLPVAERSVVVSNEFPATLTLQFPAPARVWINDQLMIDEPTAEVTLDSPVLMPGEAYTFRIRAQWAAIGREYEYNREVTLSSGEQSRLLVIAGTPTGEN